MNDSTDHKKLPQYAVIREIIREEITTGKYPVFSPIPSEKELADRFEVSVLTSRRAVSELESDGLVVKSQGKKTRVCPPKQVEPIFTLSNGNGKYASSKENVEYELLRHERIEPSGEIREKLELVWPDEDVICITRIRSIHQSRVSAYDAYLHPALCGPMLHEHLLNQSLIMTLREKYKMKPSKVEHQVEVVTANPLIADYLGICTKKNVMMIESTEYNQDGKPYLHMVEYYPADRYKFQFTVKNV